MKLTISYLTIASAVSIATATSCTHENASPWPYTEEESCDTVACAQEQAYANCIAVSAVSGRTCVRPPSMLKRKVDIDCSSTETCTVAPEDNSLVCLETFSGNFHDDDDGSGNLFLHVYTFPNGDVTTVAPSSTATAKAGDETRTTPTSASTKGMSASQSENTVATGTKSPGSSGSPSVNAAPSQYTGGAVFRSGVNAVLLAVAALPVVLAAV